MQNIFLAKERRGTTVEGNTFSEGGAPAHPWEPHFHTVLGLHHPVLGGEVENIMRARVMASLRPLWGRYHATCTTELLQPLQPAGAEAPGAETRDVVLGVLRVTFSRDRRRQCLSRSRPNRNPSNQTGFLVIFCAAYFICIWRDSV